MTQAAAVTDGTNDLRVFGSWFDGHTDTTPRPFDLPWPDFVSSLTDMFHTREGKFDPAPGFNLARFIEKDGVTVRQNKHVDVLSGIVLDFDKNFEPQSIFSKIEDLVWAAYTTFGHTPDAPRWRLVVPFASPIPASAYRSVRSWLLNRINSRQKINEADEQAKAISNFYFGPGCPEARKDDAEWLVSDGAVLEVPPLSEFKKGTPETRVLGSKIDWPFIEAKMRSYKDQAIRDAFRRVLKGRPFAEHGTRDSTLLRMCGALAGWALACDPHELAKIFAPSLALMAEQEPNDPPPDEDGAADKIARAQSSLIAKAREENEMRVEDAQTVDMPTPDTEEACAADARAVGLDDLDELRRRLLIRNANSIWMWRADLGTWSGPLTEPEAQAAARLELPLVPGAQVHQRKVDGGLRLKVLPELFHEYGERADKVTYDLNLSSARYDVGTRSLVLVGAPRRPLEPAYDARVDEWLRALGGERAEKLLDWIAGLTWHNRPNSVLFIQGDPGVGKGLFVRGLARVWDVDAAADIKNVVKNHNDDLLRCPLVRIDEGKWDRFADVTTTLRELVTQGSRMVNPKHLKLVELVGHLRFVVTANNFNIFASDRHSLTPADRDAIAERFLEIKPDPAARLLLEAIAPDERAAIATSDKLASHALWLAANRQVTSPGRFVVSGDKGGRFATKIITEDHSYGSWVIEWLARYLTSPLDIERDHSNLLWRGTDDAGNARVLVSPEAIVDTFEKTLRNRKPPQSLEISNALRSLSTGELLDFPGGRGRGFEVLVEEVAAWSEEKGVGNVASIRANARKPRAVVGAPATPAARPLGALALLQGRGRMANAD